MTNAPFPSPENPCLLTPGPLTTAVSTRQAMTRDWGSREGDFMALCQRVCRDLAAVAMAGSQAEKAHRYGDKGNDKDGGEGIGNGDDKGRHGDDGTDARVTAKDPLLSHLCIPIAGSGTTALEAAIVSLCHPQSHILVQTNGAYGRRLADICRAVGRRFTVLDGDETKPLSPARLDDALGRDSTLTHVAAVHCETASGILNPIHALADISRRHARPLMIDAMSTFGALPMPLTDGVLAVIASANKCLEGAPGLAFVMAERKALSNAGKDYRVPSLVLDLAAQWRFFEETGQFRFTPPVQIIAALADALARLGQEGGPDARLGRYQENRRLIRRGMGRLGFVDLIDPAHQSPIILSFKMPDGFDFDVFHGHLAQRGYIIYPGKMTDVPSFRIGCIGAITSTDIEGFLLAAADVLKQMDFPQVG